MDQDTSRLKSKLQQLVAKKPASKKLASKTCKLSTQTLMEELEHTLAELQQKDKNLRTAAEIGQLLLTKTDEQAAKVGGQDCIAELQANRRQTTSGLNPLFIVQEIVAGCAVR